MTEQKKTPELLPCPFCGGHDLRVHETVCGFEVFCRGSKSRACDARMWGETKERAADEWNTRSTTPAQAAKVLMDAGCSGTAQLTWEIDRALNGDPSYPPGDAPWKPPYGNDQLYDAVVAALSAMIDMGG